MSPKKEKKKRKPPKKYKQMSAQTKVEIIRLFGAYYEPTQIIREFESRGLPIVTNGRLTRMRQEHAEEIADARGRFLADFKSVPLAHKKNRVLYRQRLVHDIAGKLNDPTEEAANLWHEEETQYGTKRHGNHGIVNEILDSIKEEIEPKKISITDPTGTEDRLKELIKIQREVENDVVAIERNLAKKKEIKEGADDSKNKR